MLGKDVEITAPGKLLLLAIVAAGCLAIIIVSMITGSGDSTPAWGTLTLVVGYLIGNGVGAKRGIVSVPPLSTSPEKQLQVIEKEIEKIERQQAADADG